MTPDKKAKWIIQQSGMVFGGKQLYGAYLNMLREDLMLTIKKAEQARNDTK